MSTPNKIHIKPDHPGYKDAKELARVLASSRKTVEQLHAEHDRRMKAAEETFNAEVKEIEERLNKHLPEGMGVCCLDRELYDETGLVVLNRVGHNGLSGLGGIIGKIIGGG